MPSAQTMERARELHRRAFIMDAHVDTMSEMLDRGYDLGHAPEDAHLTWEKIETGGLKAQLFAAFVSPSFLPDRAAGRVLAVIDRFEAEVARFPNKLRACRSAADIDAAMRNHQFAGMLSIEGGHAIEDSLDN